MSEVYIVRKKKDSDSLSHSGTAGMKWGYNHGKKNNKRIAKGSIADKLGFDERQTVIRKKKAMGYYEKERNKAAKKYSKYTPKDVLKKNSHITVARTRVKILDRMYYDAGKRYLDSLKEYHKTPIGQFSKYARSVGNFLSDFFGIKR